MISRPSARVPLLFHTSGLTGPIRYLARLCLPIRSPRLAGRNRRHGRAAPGYCTPTVKAGCPARRLVVKATDQVPGAALAVDCLDCAHICRAGATAWSHLGLGGAGPPVADTRRSGIRT